MPKFLQMSAFHRKLLCFVITVSAVASSDLFAQSNYPNKPINFIVPYGAGGGADSRSRQIGLRVKQNFESSCNCRKQTWYWRQYWY
jgi:tripartite-type tricarboxylate transporter receptor subunit TctC